MSTSTLLDARDLDEWFAQEVLPLEPILMRFIQARWYDNAEVVDLRQETYLRLYEVALFERPNPVKELLFTIARNLMIDRIRKKNVISIETIAEIEWLNLSDGNPDPERHVASRQELKRMQDAMNDLPRRCRQIVMLRRVHGFSQREVAARMGIKEETVESQLVRGLRLITNAMSNKRGSLLTQSRRALFRRGL